MLRCGGRKGRCGKRYERRCRKVCWGVGEVRGDVGNCGRKCVVAPHPNTLPCTSPILSPHTNTLSHSPHTLCHTPPHTSFLTSQHTSLHLPSHPPYLFPQLPSLPPTPQHASHSPHALFHTSPHSFDYVAKLPCDDIAGTLINLTGKAR